VPGAFTPTCSSQAPGYIEKHDEFKAKGINEIYIITVNDTFVTKCVLFPCLCVRAQLVSLRSKNNKSLFLPLLLFLLLLFLLAFSILSFRFVSADN